MVGGVALITQTLLGHVIKCAASEARGHSAAGAFGFRLEERSRDGVEAAEKR